jgi:long-chain fatty acid transport protein
VTGDPEEYPDPDPGIEGTSHIEGKDTASLGATLGLQWAAARGAVVVGASVMAPTTLHFEGDAVVVNEGINELLDGQGRVMQGAGRRTDTVQTSIPLPLIARAGVTWRPKPRTSIGLDVNYQRWSTFQSLVVDFQNEPELFQSPGAKLYDVTVENDWRDTWTVRLGAEARPLPWPLTMRAGALYDQSPIDDRHFGLLTPDSDKIGVSGGLAWELHGPGGHPLGLDLSYMHVFMHERDIEPGANGAPGSDGTVLNKPAPSFFHGVTRAAFDIVYLAVSVRM